MLMPLKCISGKNQCFETEEVSLVFERQVENTNNDV